MLNSSTVSHYIIAISPKILIKLIRLFYFQYENIRFGYHAQPSMHRLHLHVISKDMNSEFLKNKKHWNSFTTEFFMNSSGNFFPINFFIIIHSIRWFNFSHFFLLTDILRQLKTSGKIKFPSAAECELMMKRELKCHRCNLVFPTIPKLKQHIRSHRAD